jgi:hypothetical protein
MKFGMAIALVVLSATTSAAEYGSNLSTMVNAAKALEFASSNNRAYLLVKRETIRAPVAVVFGYGDNERACEELANALTLSGSVGTFLCDAIY